MIESPGEFKLEESPPSPPPPPEEQRRNARNAAKAGRRRSIRLSESYVVPPEITRASSSGKDRGYAWAIVFVSFLMQFIGDGINFTFGLFYVKISNEYPGVGKSGVSWIPSIMSAMSHGIGPVGSMLVNKFGCRSVSILGSLFAAGGFGLSYYAQSPAFMYFTIGGCGGIGLGLLYLAAMVAIPQYFDKKLAFATGIACSGTGIGTLFFEYAISLMLLDFAWREGLLIVGGIFLASLPFGFLYKPFRKARASLVLPDSDSESSSSEQELSETLTTTTAKPRASTSASTSSTTLLATSTSTSSQDIFRTWSQGKELLPLKKKKKILDLSLLADASFILFSLADLLTSFGFNVPYVFLPDIEQKLTNSNSSSLLGFIAVPNVLSRIILGYFSDKKFVNRFFLYTFALSVAGIATATSPFFGTLTLLRIYCAVYGTCVGAYVSLKSVILVDILGSERLTDAFGLLLLIQATGIIMGAPIAGYLYDKYGTYSYGFYFAGGMFMLSAVVLGFIPCVHGRKLRVKARERAIAQSLEEKAVLLERQVAQAQTQTQRNQRPAKVNYSTFPSSTTNTVPKIR